MTVYISVKDRPAGAWRTAPPADKRRVAPVVVTLGFVSMLTDISSESVAAILPLYLTAVIGLSPAAYGFVDGLYQGVSSVVRIGGGWAADRSGHPKWVAFVGYALSMFSRLALIFATGVAAIVATISTDRVGKGIRTAPRDVMISNATESSQLGRAFGVHRALDTVGAAIGPLIAFVILWVIPDGYKVVLVTSFAFALLGVLLLGLVVSDHPPVTGQRRSPAAPRYRWRDLGDRRLIRLLVVAGVLGLLTIGDGFLYLALLDRGDFATHWFPMFYVGTNVAYLALAIPLGRLADRYGRARVLVLGHTALLAAYLCAVVPMGTGGAGLTVATLLLLGTFYASNDGVIAALAGRLVTPNVRASGIAAAQSVTALARFGASSCFGLLWYAVGRADALTAVSVALAIAIPLALVSVARLDSTAAVA